MTISSNGNVWHTSNSLPEGAYPLSTVTKYVKATFNSVPAWMKVALNGAKGNPALIALAYESEPGEKNSLGFILSVKPELTAS